MTLIHGIEHRLPGVFAGVPFKYAVNGSLWTLPYELKMYACLAVIGIILVYLQTRIRTPIIKTAFLVIAILAITANLINHFQPLGSDKFIRLSAMFSFGVMFYQYRDNIILSRRLAVFALMTVLLALVHKNIFFVAYNLALPYLILYTAYIPAGVIRKFNKIGDYSYGIYIYAFPVQQSLAATIPDLSVTAMVGASFAITLPLAFLSWNLIEKRCLRLKGKYPAFKKLLVRAILTDKIGKPERTF